MKVLSRAVRLTGAADGRTVRPPMKTSILRIALLVACVAGARGAGAEATPVVTVPRVTHPGAGQTIYFVLTDRFANGSTANDRGGFGGGADDHGFDPARLSHFHGGDFAGLTARLDYLKRLGVTAVWVTPPFRNKPVQAGTAGYHGYWILDFRQIDPHLGTNAEFQEFVRQAHARGLRVFMDIIVNHTADVIQFADGVDYVDMKTAPYRDAQGRVFDPRAAAWNGLGDPAAFPVLSVERSFARPPLVPPAEADAKFPAWLNDPALYHNRGNSTFLGESAVHGDFAGLDDLFTEHPRVVQGFIDLFRDNLAEFGVDGFRIDTAKHVNAAFWQAFSPALREHARALGRPEFLQFGEVYNEAGDPAFLAEFSTGSIPIDTTLDFGFFAAARRFVAQGGTAGALADFFARDDHYIDHDGNVHATTTFLGNHDAGRFAYFVQQDNPGASAALVGALVRLGHGLLFLSRGQPVLYYGDEQGMIGRGGGDMQAREDMFAAQTPEFRSAPLLATTRTGADDKFDEAHPFYRLFRELAALRAAAPALRTGAMVPRWTAEPGLFAFSRIERDERIEYLVALNNSRTLKLRDRVPTGQPAAAQFARVFASSPEVPDDEQTLVADADGAVRLTLPPLQFAVWRAERTLPVPAAAPRIALVRPATGARLEFGPREVDGQVFPTRQEIRAEVAGGDGCAEVTFVLARSSRPGQFELIGTDDTAPYRVFWAPPADLAADEELTLIASVDDLRGHRAATQVEGVTVAVRGVESGIRGARVPVLTALPPASLVARAGEPLRLTVAAEGTGSMEYQWYRDGGAIGGATEPTFAAPARAGTYRVQVRNLAGTTVSRATMVTLAPGPGD